MEPIESLKPLSSLQQVQTYKTTQNIDNVYGQSILDMQQYNGRINLLEQPPPDLKFAMFERIAIKNKASEFRNPIGNAWEETTLSVAFFSAANIQILQNGLRAGVYNLSKGKFSIPPQNSDQLKMIMRAIFSQYAMHQRDVPVKEQIAVLNEKVLDYVVPYLYNEAVAYIKYCEDQSTLVVPLDLPRQCDRDYKQLEYNRYFRQVDYQGN